MKKIIFSLFVVSFVLFSCGEKAIDVNKTIVSEIGKVNSAVEAISSYISLDEYDMAKAQIDSLVVQVAASEEAINLLQSKQAIAYKQSAIDYISFIRKEVPAKFGKAIDLFLAAKLREQEDVAKGKQSASMINSGPDFDEARAILKNFKKELKKVQDVLLEKQEKFITANGLGK